ncbi:phage holin family protein [Paenibacillus spongiae]|uniref:Phage holin family protein n=1 Tax=Paenibacillus spongiae TaxID=2909671 RepID=A0ABY5S3B1_9BACL|nr:phage holin family protein [Paenibacillus spongiae]UVI28154.1 phage holin family protein [Paenibacillus spongiae]
MEWNAIMELIDTKLLGVVSACWVLGLSIKRIPRIPDWTIVFILTVGAIVAVIFMSGPSVEAVLQGILCAAVAVYGNQLVKQSREGAGRDDLYR